MNVGLSNLKLAHGRNRPRIVRNTEDWKNGRSLPELMIDATPEAVMEEFRNVVKCLSVWMGEGSYPQVKENHFLRYTTHPQHDDPETLGSVSTVVADLGPINHLYGHDVSDLRLFFLLREMNLSVHRHLSIPLHISGLASSYRYRLSLYIPNADVRACIGSICVSFEKPDTDDRYRTVVQMTIRQKSDLKPLGFDIAEFQAGLKQATEDTFHYMKEYYARRSGNAPKNALLRFKELKQFRACLKKLLKRGPRNIPVIISDEQRDVWKHICDKLYRISEADSAPSTTVTAPVDDTKQTVGYLKEELLGICARIKQHVNSTTTMTTSDLKLLDLRTVLKEEHRKLSELYDSL